jgi:hypothetical protein
MYCSGAWPFCCASAATSRHACLNTLCSADLMVKSGGRIGCCCCCCCLMCKWQAQDRRRREAARTHHVFRRRG